MTEEKLRERLQEQVSSQLSKQLLRIEDLSARKEAREIYQSVFQQLAYYQEQKLQQLEQQVKNSICESQADYGIDMFLTSHEDSRKWEDVCGILNETKCYPWDWNQKQIKRVYLELSQHQLKQVKKEQRTFHAVVRTNCDVYKCKVALQEDEKTVETINTFNEIMESNGVDQPLLPNCFVERFCDVIFLEQQDKLRAEERIEFIEIDWEELEDCVKEDVVLMVNFRECQLKEKVFPVPEQNEVRFQHEIIVANKKYAYILDVSKLSNYEISRQQDTMVIKTTNSNYQIWNAYEIVPRTEWEKAGKATNVLSTRLKNSVIDYIQRGRKTSKAELHRMITSYEVASYFERIEIIEDTICFYAKQDTYVERACMEMIMTDIKAMYNGLQLTGVLYMT